jgi:hypothetical protein
MGLLLITKALQPDLGLTLPNYQLIKIHRFGGHLMSSSGGGHSDGFKFLLEGIS